ncbi:hypothetical protein [Cellulomonas sp. URHB0016]
MAAAIALAAVVTATGCTGSAVDAESLVGAYASVDTDGELVLADDSTFTAVSVPSSVLGDVMDAERVDLSGRWEYLETSGADFVYLSIDEVVGGASLIAGVQLYVSRNGDVYFRPDPDRATTVVYEPTGRRPSGRD